MNGFQTKKMLIAVGLSGILVNLMYGVGLLKAFFLLPCDNVTKEFIISGIALEFGWIALLVWMIFKPVERRYLLLFTAIPMMLGNILHSVHQFVNLHSSIGAVVLNLGVGLLYTGVFVGAYFLAES